MFKAQPASKAPSVTKVVMGLKALPASKVLPARKVSKGPPARPVSKVRPVDKAQPASKAQPGPQDCKVFRVFKASLVLKVRREILVALVFKGLKVQTVPLAHRLV